MMENQEHILTWESPDKTFSKKIKQEGKGSAKPNDGTVCLVHITPLVACSITDNVIGYKLNRSIDMCIGNGDCELSEIFEACVESMKEEEIAELLIPSTIVKKKWPEFKDDPPTDATADSDRLKNVVFSLELKAFTPRKHIWELDPSEKLTRATEFKDIGTNNFKREKYDMAEKFYTKSLKVLVTMGVESGITAFEEDQMNSYNTVRCAALLNLAACQLKRDKFEFVVEHCNNALEIDSKNVKGLYRRGQAYMALNEFEKAKEDLKYALQLEPKNKPIIKQLRVLDSKIKEHRAQYKKGMSKMFGGPV
ncbi:peptidyl-prolyl cis-trans isomerase FKBP4-like [Anneissia japonica]|uniref:peptidyl-prolyl cis-trans isomerase FKBP4-like n=1 Tax=Anneissia japonica TaxID=1529436 RepID=UPI0014259290|nr:peptidyl-prolyl cis-trans isomerase FKBP4-like [Anneissia japonica]